MAVLAAALGTSRSKLLRAAFAAVEHDNGDVLRARIAALPPDRRAGPRPRRPAERVEVAAAP